MLDFKSTHSTHTSAKPASALRAFAAPHRALLGCVLALSAFALLAPSAQAQKRKGNFNASVGLGYATSQTTFTDGRGNTTTESGGSETGLVLNLDYRYPISDKFSIGPALQYWSLGGSNDTSIAALASYAISDKSEAYLALGNTARFGYSQAFGKTKADGKGTFFVFEFVAPNDDRVDSFGYLGIGYKF